MAEGSSIEELSEQFSIFGVKLSDETARECLALSKKYGMDGEQMAVLWLTFSCNNDYDTITLEALEHLDRVQGALNKKTNVSTPSSKVKAPPVYNDFDAPQECDHNEDEEELLAAYGVGSGGNKSSKLALTPKDKKSKVRPISAQFNSPNLSPTVASPSVKFASRTNFGTVVTQYVTLENNNKAWNANPNFRPKVKLLESEDNPSLIKEYVYMNERALAVARSRKYMTLSLGEEMQDSMLDKDDETGMDHFSTLDSTAEGMIATIGRIHCGRSNRLDADNVMFEGIQQGDRGKIVPLDLSQVNGWSLFPGQIVGVKGAYPVGNKLRVQELLDGKVPPLSKTPITITKSTGPVQLVVASGPFTTTSNLLYEPLSDLLTTLRKNPPHVLILLGPFLDASHPLVVQNDLGETHDTIFKRCLRIIASALEDTQVQVVLVASSQDVCSPMVYPTPPYNVPGNFMRVSDPALLDIEGVVVALTATDILFHLGKKEISTPPQKIERLVRLTQHLLKQRNFYPLYPAHTKMCLASEKLYSYGGIPCVPHLFVIPSDLRYFTKEVEGCVMVNPEHLAKGVIGGTYARIELQPPSNDRGMAESVNINVLKV